MRLKQLAPAILAFICSDASYALEFDFLRRYTDHSFALMEASCHNDSLDVGDRGVGIKAKFSTDEVKEAAYQFQRQYNGQVLFHAPPRTGIRRYELNLEERVHAQQLAAYAALAIRFTYEHPALASLAKPQVEFVLDGHVKSEESLPIYIGHSICVVDTFPFGLLLADGTMRKEHIRTSSGLQAALALPPWYILTDDQSARIVDTKSYIFLTTSMKPEAVILSPFSEILPFMFDAVIREHTQAKLADAASYHAVLEKQEERIRLSETISESIALYLATQLLGRKELDHVNITASDVTRFVNENGRKYHRYGSVMKAYGLIEERGLKYVVNLIGNDLFSYAGIVLDQ